MSFQVPIVQHFCTCTDEDYNPTQLGWRQKEYEDLRLSGLSFYDTMEKMKVKRLCCREKYMNPPFLFMRIADIDRIRDETGMLAKGGKIKGYNKIKTVKGGEEILPKRPFPEIPK
jgi:hypothetical protein